MPEAQINQMEPSKPFEAKSETSGSSRACEGPNMFCQLGFGYAPVQADTLPFWSTTAVRQPLTPLPAPVIFVLPCWSWNGMFPLRGPMVVVESSQGISGMYFSAEPPMVEFV